MEIENNPPSQKSEAIDNEKTTLPVPPLSDEKLLPLSSLPHHPKLSLKDDYLIEYDEDHSHDYLQQNDSIFSLSNHFANSWRSFLKIFAAMFLVIFLIGGFLYLWISDQTGEEETKVAKGVADIAMSLTYAQLKHIHHQNQNWSYPDFIKNNLMSILAPNHKPLADIDTHGQFADSPYILRIYTSSDLSHFLVIAQPSPSLLQWIIPKASIIVDSRAMEMRKIKDLKALNRLIVNSNSLDGVNAYEISNLVKQGELITLSSLINKKENEGIAPPKALGLIHPGAENLIYNAPRYYLLGERILNDSFNLSDKHPHAKDINLLEQELLSILKFPNFVLYSSSGIEHAIKAQKALGKLHPHDKFIIAYLQLNTHGKISKTHLLMDDASSEIAVAEIKPTSEIKKSLKIYVEEQAETEIIVFDVTQKEEENELFSIDTIDVNDPLFLQLSSIANFRQSILKPIADKINTLLGKQTTQAQFDFKNRINKLMQKYLNVDKEQQSRIFKKFSTILHENTTLPAEKFIHFLEAAHLKSLFQQYLYTMKLEAQEHQMSDEHVEQQFKQIEESTTWKDLEHHVIQTAQILQFNHIFDISRLLSFQDAARTLIMQKLNQFILSSNETIAHDDLALDYLEKLNNILKAGWLTDQESYDFYLSEFELRAAT